MVSDYDVIVVGGGPGGASASRFCASRGLRTLLLEKERLPRYKPCGGCLSLKTIRLLEFDINPVIENTINEAKFTYRLKKSFSIKSEAPFGFLVMRDRFDKFLIEKALAEGVTLLEGEKVIGVSEIGERVEVELARGNKFYSKYLIGADGAESTVSKSISLWPKNRNGMAIEGEIPFTISLNFPKEDIQSIHLDFGRIPNGYGWVFPKKEFLSVGIGGMMRENNKINPRKYFDSFVKELGYINELKIGKIMGHPLPSFYDEKQRVSSGRILLVGDAAHLMDPLMGEGIYYAIQSGRLAAEAILQSIERGIAPCDLYQEMVETHISKDLKWALRFSDFVFRFTKLAYETMRYYPELGNFYLSVLGGSESYHGFVLKVKERINDLLKGHLSERIRRAIDRSRG